jgi:hypothetical protein
VDRIGGAGGRFDEIVVVVVVILALFVSISM